MFYLFIYSNSGFEYRIKKTKVDTPLFETKQPQNFISLASFYEQPKKGYKMLPSRKRKI